MTDKTTASIGLAHLDKLREEFERAFLSLNGFHTKAEIADLRAALARAPLPAPVVSDNEIPQTTDQAREYLVEWHKANLKHAPYFSNYIQTQLAGDFAFHLARWLARNAGQAHPVDDARDAARLDFLDTNVHRFRMGWEVGAAPVGNLSVRSIIMGGKPIREAIDAAMRANDSAAEGERP